MSPFFQASDAELVGSPNGLNWWHSMPLPDGRRIDGANADKSHQFKAWHGLGIPSENGLEGKTVLDIGANDGFFSLAALMAGAKKVVAINTADWDSYPKNLHYASNAWGIHPETLTADFRTHPFEERFDVIFFFGVLYHLQDVFGCMKRLRDLMHGEGVLYLETQMAKAESSLPIFEYASDIYSTSAIQYKRALGQEGLSNYLFPNESAIRNLAYSYDFHFESLDGPKNLYLRDSPRRGQFKLTRMPAEGP